MERQMFIGRATWWPVRGAIIALFGFLNRWSDTMGSELEPLPQSFAASIDLGARKLGS